MKRTKLNYEKVKTQFKENRELINKEFRKERAKLRDEGMELEVDMFRKSQELQRLNREMEQEAKPAGGLMADTYAEFIEKASNELRELRAKFNEVMAKIDQFDQNYLGDEYEDFNL